MRATDHTRRRLNQMSNQKEINNTILINTKYTRIQSDLIFKIDFINY